MLRVVPGRWQDKKKIPNKNQSKFLWNKRTDFYLLFHYKISEFTIKNAWLKIQPPLPHVYVWHICVVMCSHTHACKSQRKEVLGVFFCQFQPYFLKSSFLLNVKLAVSASLAGRPQNSKDLFVSAWNHVITSIMARCTSCVNARTLNACSLRT